ncbi:aaa ATPase [Trichoderma compactum]
MNEVTLIDLTGETPDSTPGSTPDFEEPPSSIANAIPLSEASHKGGRPVLCKEQRDLIELVLTGRNVFFTGSAGCGKSTVLKAAVNLLHMMGKNIHVVAPTGRAALQTPDYHKLDIDTLLNKGFRKHIEKRLKDTDVLIIDEISMVENHHLERMNTCMKAVIAWKAWRRERDSAPPRTRRDAFAIAKSIPAFGGIQVVPFKFFMHYGKEIITNDDGAEFNGPNSHGLSAAWEEADCVHETKILINYPYDVQKAIKLLCTRNKVAMINQENFNSLKTPKLEYHALDGFITRQEPYVILRGGMLVILQINLDIKGGLVNGSQSIICGLERFSSGNLPKRIISDYGGLRLAKAWPQVLFHNSVKRVIYPSCVVNSVGDKELYLLLHRTQFPLLLGWAIKGRVYVALSRATSLYGLKVIGSLSGLFVTGGNPEVQTFLLAKEFSGHLLNDGDGEKYWAQG